MGEPMVPEMGVDDRLLEAGYSQADVTTYRRWWLTGAGYDNVATVELIDSIESLRQREGF